MIIWILLFILQTTLIMPIVMLWTEYWDQKSIEDTQNSARQHMLYFVVGMVYIASIAYGMSFILDLIILSSNNWQVDLSGVGTSLPINIVFILSALYGSRLEKRMHG